MRPRYEALNDGGIRLTFGDICYIYRSNQDLWEDCDGNPVPESALPESFKRIASHSKDRGDQSVMPKQRSEDGAQSS